MPPLAPRPLPVLAALLGACAAMPAAAQHAEHAGGQAQASATFVDTEGAEAGTALLWEVPTGGVLIDFEIEGLPGGEWLAVHVHEGSECDAEGDFESAGGHFNPTGAEHGFLAEGGPHAGDMPNQYVPDDGTLRAQVFNPMVSLETDPSIRGLALIVHAGHDDHASQPSGDAGDRLACALIE